MKENNSLKDELDSLRKELEIARQDKSRETTLDILAQAAIAMNEGRDHMCYEYGNIYFQAGYKVVKVLVTGNIEEPTNFSVKTEYDPTAPQEPVGHKIFQSDKVAASLPTSLAQEPLLQLKVVTQATQKEPLLEPLEVETHKANFEEKETQTYFYLETTNVGVHIGDLIAFSHASTKNEIYTAAKGIQKDTWDQLAEVQKWKKEVQLVRKGLVPYEWHLRALKEFKEKWLQDINENWEPIHAQLKKIKSLKQMIRELEQRLIL